MPRDVYAVIHDLHAGLEELRDHLTRIRELFETRSTTPRRPRARKRSRPPRHARTASARRDPS